MDEAGQMRRDLWALEQEQVRLQQEIEKLSAQYAIYGRVIERLRGALPSKQPQAHEANHEEA